MKITETISRECCQRQDLKPYHGARNYPIADEEGATVFFCIHCGQLWEAEHEQLPVAGDIQKMMWRITV